MTERSARKPRPQGIIRPYRPEDRDAVRDICCRTAFRNKGCELMFEDRELHADYWTSYYTDTIPDQVWIAEVEGEVVGYFFGCTDTRAYLRAMSRRIVPVMVLRSLGRLALGRYRKRETRAYLWHMLRHGAAEAPPMDFDRYPAHFHCNILRKGIGQQFYSRMLIDFLDRLQGQGVDRLHGFLTEEADGGQWGKVIDGFLAAHPDVGFEVLTERPTRVMQAVLGDDRPMMNRGWGMTVANFQIYVRYLRDHYRL